MNKGGKTKTSTSIKRESKTNGTRKSVNRASKASSKGGKKKGKTLEEKVLEIEEDMTGDMTNLKKDDVKKVTHLKILEKNHNNLVPIAESDAQKNEQAQKYLNDLIQGIEEMKGQDSNDIEELKEIKGQLDNDMEEAIRDKDALENDRPDFIYGPEAKTLKGKHKAIHTFLLNTLNQRNGNIDPILDENQVLKGKVRL